MLLENIHLRPGHQFAPTVRIFRQVLLNLMQLMIASAMLDILATLKIVLHVFLASTKAISGHKHALIALYQKHQFQKQILMKAAAFVMLDLV